MAKREVKVITLDRETHDAYLRCTGRAFERGLPEVFRAAQALVNTENVAEYCERLVADQISYKAAKKLVPVQKSFQTGV